MTIINKSYNILAVGCRKWCIFSCYFFLKCRLFIIKFGSFFIAVAAAAAAVGMALVTKCVTSYSQRRLRCCISHLYSSKRHFRRVSLLTRWSAFVKKWVCCMRGEAFKKKLVHSVTLTIMA